MRPTAGMTRLVPRPTMQDMATDWAREEDTATAMAATIHNGCAKYNCKECIF